MNDQPSALTATDLAIGYPGRGGSVIASGLNLVLAPGQFVCMLGANGVGKSTLLRTLAGMQAPLGGRVTLGGEDLARLSLRERATRCAVVLTDRIAAGHLSVYALVGLGRHPYTDWSGRLRPEDSRVVDWALDAVGAGQFARRYVDQLSDGERQKVMIARALAQQPALLLLDEPTAFLDLHHRLEIVRVLRHLARAGCHAMLLTTHDLDLAVRTADQLWIMRPGRPLLCGAPEDLILRGELQDAFCNDHIAFDARSGMFTLEDAATDGAVLEGQGTAADWTERALARVGFHMTTDPSAARLRVSIDNSNGRTVWDSDCEGRNGRHESIGEMTAWIRREQQASRTDLPTQVAAGTRKGQDDGATD